MKTETINRNAMVQSHFDRDIASRYEDLAKRAARHTNGKGNGVHPTAIAQLEFMRDDASRTICNVYEPALAIGCN